MTLRLNGEGHHRQKWTKAVIPGTGITAVGFTACEWPALDAPMGVVLAAFLVWLGWLGVRNRNDKG